MANNSASDIYTVTFRLIFENRVNADGPDAFADSNLFLTDSLNVDDIFFSDIKSDTLFGDEVGGALTGTFGNELVQGNSADLFTYTLNPTDVVNLNMSWTLEGGDFDTMGLATASMSARLLVDSVTVKTPLPGTVVMVALGIVLLPLQRRLRGKQLS